MSLDPRGYYALLGVEPTALPPDIAAAYRRRARLLHPDVPETGSTEKFIAVKQAYDILSDPEQRQAYDRAARLARMEAIEPADLGIPMAPVMVEPPMRRPQLSDMPLAVWGGIGLILVISIYQLVVSLTAPVPERASIRPNAPTVAPSALPPAPPPRQPGRLVGVPNHYTVPSPGPTTVWRVEADTNRLIVIGQLQPFTPVQAIRVLRQPGLMEIRVSDSATGLIQAARLAPGNEEAAHRAFCGYHAGAGPISGEVLHRRGTGNGSLRVHNRSSAPAVVKLRDRAGATAAAIYVGPGDEIRVTDLPEGVFRPDYAFGEIWSRACNAFAVGMHAARLPSFRSLPALTPLVIPPDVGAQEQPIELPDKAFKFD